MAIIESASELVELGKSDENSIVDKSDVVRNVNYIFNNKGELIKENGLHRLFLKFVFPFLTFLFLVWLNEKFIYKDHNLIEALFNVDKLGIDNIFQVLLNMGDLIIMQIGKLFTIIISLVIDTYIVFFNLLIELIKDYNSNLQIHTLPLSIDYLSKEVWKLDHQLKLMPLFHNIIQGFYILLLCIYSFSIYGRHVQKILDNAGLRRYYVPWFYYIRFYNRNKINGNKYSIYLKMINTGDVTIQRDHALKYAVSRVFGIKSDVLDKYDLDVSIVDKSLFLNMFLMEELQCKIIEKKKASTIVKDNVLDKNKKLKKDENLSDVKPNEIIDKKSKDENLDNTIEEFTDDDFVTF
jgi:hypothetical protein